MGKTRVHDFVAEGFASGWKHIDASRLSEDTTLETDVVILGTGAGGGTAAEILAQAGLDVVMIEEGPLKTSNDFRMREDEAFSQLYQEGGGRTTRDGGIKIYQGRMVGGGTGVNWTTCFRTPPATLRHWTEELGLDGFTVEEMRPWFERMEKRHNIHLWKVPPNENNRSIIRGCEQLGWEWGAIKRNVRGCQNLGYCGTACPVNAKQSTLVSTVPGALKRGALLISRARGERYDLHGDTVRELECVAMSTSGNAPSGTRIRVRARHFVLAAGAIGSPAILLRSGLPQFDPHRLVGKRTFLHPVALSAAWMPHRINGESGAPQTAYSDHWIQQRLDNEKMGFKLEAMPLQPITVATTLDSHGAERARLMQRRPFLTMVLALQRDGFHPDSIGGSVYLRPDGTPGLDYPISPYVWDGLHDALLKMAELQFAAGAKQVMPVHRDAQLYGSWAEARNEIQKLPMQPLKVRVSSAHVMGGCPMGTDPSNSVVDTMGRHHELSNLSVFDGSVFPTSVAANPMESIFATAAKFATGLAAGLTGRRTP